MQGLVSYSDDSDDERRLSQPVTGLPTNGPKADMTARNMGDQRLRSPAPTASSGKVTTKKHLAGIRLNTRPYISSPSSSRSEQAVASSSKLSTDENSSDHTRGSPRSPAHAATSSNGKSKDVNTSWEGLTDDEIFRRITLPKEIEGKVDWGIPAVTDEEPEEGLKVKVANFLEMKQDRGMHINTTLLSSTAFANPHIYAKLVEFVDIDERGSAFPGGGWLTRRGLEDRVPDWGKAAIADLQKSAAAAVKASQVPGQRSNIAFTSGASRTDRDQGHPRRMESGRSDRMGGSRDARLRHGESSRDRRTKWDK